MTTNRPGADLQDQLAALGPFFAVDGHDPHRPPRDGWRRLSDIVDVPGVLSARVDTTRAVLAAGTGHTTEAVEVRVAASVVQLGMTARLLSPLLALAALGDVDHVPALADLHWQDVVDGAFPLSLPDPMLQATAGPPRDWNRWADVLLAGPLTALSQSVSALIPSEHVRHGNIASAVNGAVTVIAAAPPDHHSARQIARAQDLAERLLRLAALRDASVGAPGTRGFRRRNCCLIYRAAGIPASPTSRPVCGDCVLAVSSS